MSFCCPIHGYYSPVPGATIAMCPSCQVSMSPQIQPARGGLITYDEESLRNEVQRASSARLAAERELRAAQDRLAELTETLARIADGYIPASAAAGMARRALDGGEPFKCAECRCPTNYCCCGPDHCDCSLPELVPNDGLGI